MNEMDTRFANQYNIQWFPGHMTKTLRMMEQEIQHVDASLVLLDARIPLSSLNPEIERITARKPKLYALNKADLADPAVTEEWIRYFRAADAGCVAISAKQKGGANAVKAAIEKELSGLLERRQNRGMGGAKTQVMLCGIPNVGKSTFINTFAGSARAKAADRPGVTKGKQWVSTEKFDLLDMPGVLWKKFDSKTIASNLAFIGSIKDDILDVEELAMNLLDEVRRNYPDLVAQRYKLDAETLALPPYELLEAIGRKRGLLVRGGEVNTERCAIIMSPAPARTSSGSQMCQALMCLGAMAGLIGKPGCCAACDKGHAWELGGYSTIFKGGGMLGEPRNGTLGSIEYIPNPLNDKKVDLNEMWTSIVYDQEYTGLDGNKYKNPTHLIYDRHENFLNQGAGLMLGIEAYRKVDTVIAQNLVMTTTCKYADIVLPVSSMWERFGDFTVAYREQMIWTSQVCDPLFECKSDPEIALELADRLGVDKNVLRPVSEKQNVVNMVAAAQVSANADDTWENLVSITEEDLAELGVEGTPQEGRIPILDFKRQGIYTIERSEGDGRNYVPMEAFRKDPENNPVKSESGKMEFYCQAFVDAVDNWGFAEVPPIAKYIPAVEGYEDTFSNWETKEKGEYPFQIISWHILRHSHSTFADVPNLREAFDHPLYMNPVDAEQLGLETGETVLITSKWGKCLRPLMVIDTIMPGVLAMGQGAWVEIDEETGIDMAGSMNVLCGPKLTPTGYQSYNSTIVRVDKWDGEPLQPDYLWEAREVFEEE